MILKPQRKKVLLTGAGFTKNFGAPLSSELSSIIFNIPEINQDEKLKTLLLSNDHTDIEKIYSTVINNQEKYSIETRKRLETSINKVFKTMDKELENSLPFTPNDRNFSSFATIDECNIQSRIYYREIVKFIRLFSELKCGAGYIFTLNQDLFLERLFKCFSINLVHPAMNSPAWHYSPSIQNPGYVKNKQAILTAISTFEQKNEHDKNNPLYIKLHGSYGWRYEEEESNVLIFGDGKKERIDDEPLLKHYFNIFENTLSQDNLDLLIIGYSFRDGHINNLIQQAILNYNLKFHYITAIPYNNFVINFKENKIIGISLETFNSGLSGYYVTQDIRDIFPYTDTIVPDLLSEHVIALLSEKIKGGKIWAQLKENFFENSAYC